MLSETDLAGNGSIRTRDWNFSGKVFLTGDIEGLYVGWKEPFGECDRKNFENLGGFFVALQE